MAEPHQGTVELSNTFETVHHWLQLNGPVELSTIRGLRYTAKGVEAVKGLKKGEKVIRFFLGTRQLCRVYDCCWGHLTNCSGLSILAYCRPLDRVVFFF